METNNNITWIPVETSIGMFTSEFAVSVKLADGKQVSLFADKGLVQNKGEKEYLKVYLVNDCPEENKRVVLLPTETFETASRWIVVSSQG